MRVHDNERAAALYAGVSVSFLRKRRRLKLAPAFLRAGRRVVYSRDDIDAFLHERRVEPSETVGGRTA